VDWVDLPDAAPRDDSLRYRAKERGAARLRRGEGIWYADGQIFICSTAGGPAGAGQIFKLDPERGNSGASLELIAASPSDQVLDHPDNITVAPWGDVLMAEDGFSSSQYLRALTPDGRIYDVARNAGSATEFAGVCFSPDGATLFVNLQVDGLTLAITGPFERLSAA
jgi:secreted PhoX family phosphatase